MIVLDGQSAAFDNPAYDYPTRIRYWREGEMLRAGISGPDGADIPDWTSLRR